MYCFSSDLEYDDYGRCDKGTVIEYLDSRARSIMNVIKRGAKGRQTPKCLSI